MLRDEAESRDRLPARLRLPRRGARRGVGGPQRGARPRRASRRPLPRGPLRGAGPPRAPLPRRRHRHPRAAPRDRRPPSPRGRARPAQDGRDPGEGDPVRAPGRRRPGPGPGPRARRALRGAGRRGTGPRPRRPRPPAGARAARAGDRRRPRRGGVRPRLPRHAPPASPPASARRPGRGRGPASSWSPDAHELRRRPPHVRPLRPPRLADGAEEGGRPPDDPPLHQEAPRLPRRRRAVDELQRPPRDDRPGPGARRADHGGGALQGPPEAGDRQATPGRAAHRRRAPDRAAAHEDAAVERRGAPSRPVPVGRRALRVRRRASARAGAVGPPDRAQAGARGGPPPARALEPAPPALPLERGHVPPDRRPRVDHRPDAAADQRPRRPGEDARRDQPRVAPLGVRDDAPDRGPVRPGGPRRWGVSRRGPRKETRWGSS